MLLSDNRLTMLEKLVGRSEERNRLQTFKVDDGIDLVNAAVETTFGDHLRCYFLRLQQSYG